MPRSGTCLPLGAATPVRYRALGQLPADSPLERPEQPALYLFEPFAVFASDRTALPCVGEQVFQLIKHHIDHRGRFNTVRSHIVFLPDAMESSSGFSMNPSGDWERVIYVPVEFQVRTKAPCKGFTFLGKFAPRAPMQPRPLASHNSSVDD
jgi:hypothetical protein